MAFTRDMNEMGQKELLHSVSFIRWLVSALWAGSGSADESEVGRTSACLPFLKRKIKTAEAEARPTGDLPERWAEDSTLR